MSSFLPSGQEVTLLAAWWRHRQPVWLLPGATLILCGFSPGTLVSLYGFSPGPLWVFPLFPATMSTVAITMEASSVGQQFLSNKLLEHSRKPEELVGGPLCRGLKLNPGSSGWRCVPRGFAQIMGCHEPPSCSLFQMNAAARAQGLHTMVGTSSVGTFFDRQPPCTLGVWELLRNRNKPWKVTRRVYFHKVNKKARKGRAVSSNDVCTLHSTHNVSWGLHFEVCTASCVGHFSLGHLIYRQPCS